MDFAPAYMMDYSLLASIVKDKCTKTQALVNLVKGEVIKGSQARNMEDVPEALVKIATKEAVQVIFFDVKHKVEAISIGLSLHGLYKYGGIHKYFPDTTWLELFSEAIPSASAGLACMLISRLAFIGLVGPAIRYDQKRRMIEKGLHERLLKEEELLKRQIEEAKRLLEQDMNTQVST